MTTYFIKVKSIGEKNFGELVSIRQIRQGFLPPKFFTIRYYVVKNDRNSPRNSHTVPIHSFNFKKYGLVRESNPGPLAP